MTDYSKVREQLQKQLELLTDRAERIDDHLREPTDDDWEERATEMEDDDVLAGVGNLAIEEISQIKRALREIDAGTYGKCMRCGTRIPPERLELLPYATTCINCA